MPAAGAMVGSVTRPGSAGWIGLPTGGGSAGCMGEAIGANVAGPVLLFVALMPMELIGAINGLRDIAGAKDTTDGNG